MQTIIGAINIAHINYFRSLILIRTLFCYLSLRFLYFCNRMHKGKDNYTFLTAEPIHKVVITMAVPTIISMLVTSLLQYCRHLFCGTNKHTSYGSRGHCVFGDVLHTVVLVSSSDTGRETTFHANWVQNATIMPYVWHRMVSSFRSHLV